MTVQETDWQQGKNFIPPATFCERSIEKDIVKLSLTNKQYFFIKIVQMKIGIVDCGKSLLTKDKYSFDVLTRPSKNSWIVH